MKIEPLTETEMAGLNPGIRTTVQTLRSWGFQTMDSGDGKTHQFDCDRQHPYVVIRVDPARLVVESHRLMELLEGRSVRFDDPPHAQDDPEGWVNYPRMESIYLPMERMAVIDIANVILPENVRGLALATESAPPIQVEVCRYRPTSNQGG